MSKVVDKTQLGCGTCLPDVCQGGGGEAFYSIFFFFPTLQDVLLQPLIFV